MMMYVYHTSAYLVKDFWKEAKSIKHTFRTPIRVLWLTRKNYTSAQSSRSNTFEGKEYCSAAFFDFTQTLIKYSSKAYYLI